MTNSREGTSRNLKKIILENLKDLDINTERIEIGIEEGNRIILKGEVNSREEKNLVLQVVLDETDIDDIVDNLIILQELGDFSRNSLNPEDNDDWCDEDNECVGTEDIFRSVEDGLPYIPPMRPTYHQNSSKLIKWKKRKKKAV